MKPRRHPRLSKYWSRHPWQHRAATVVLIALVGVAALFVHLLDAAIEGVKHGVDIWNEDWRDLANDIREIWRGE